VDKTDYRMFRIFIERYDYGYLCVDQYFRAGVLVSATVHCVPLNSPMRKWRRKFPITVEMP